MCQCSWLQTSVCMASGFVWKAHIQSKAEALDVEAMKSVMTWTYFTIFHHISTVWSSVVNKLCHAHWIVKCFLFHAMMSCRSHAFKECLELQESRSKVQSAFCSYAPVCARTGCSGIRDQANSGRGEAKCWLLIFANAARSFIFLLHRHGFQPKPRRPGFFTLFCRREQCWSAPAQLKIRRAIVVPVDICWLDMEVEVAASTANSPWITHPLC